MRNGLGIVQFLVQAYIVIDLVCDKCDEGDAFAIGTIPDSYEFVSNRVVAAQAESEFIVPRTRLSSACKTLGILKLVKQTFQGFCVDIWNRPALIKSHSELKSADSSFHSKSWRTSCGKCVCNVPPPVARQVKPEVCEPDEHAFNGFAPTRPLPSGGRSPWGDRCGVFG